METQITPATELIELHGTHTLERGGELYNLSVAVERFGPEGAPVVLVFTGLSPSAHIASSEKDPSKGWWEFIVGSGKAIDTDKYHLVCVNSIGSCKGSTGPASIDPRTGESYDKDFPDITVWDIAEFTARAMEQIDITDIHCVVGPSMGGMTALAWIACRPGRTKHMLNISSASEADPFAIALRSLQREIIKADPEYIQGRYGKDMSPVPGMVLARVLGLISYRSGIEWRNRFGRQRTTVESAYPDQEFEIESYLKRNAERFCKEFDPNSYIKLSQSMDWFSFREKYAEPARQIAICGLRTASVMAVSSDMLFPVYQQRALYDLLVNSGSEVDYHLVECPYGHDAFLVEEQQFSNLISEYMQKTAPD